MGRYGSSLACTQVSSRSRGHLGHQAGELGVAREVVRHLRVATRQLLAGELARCAARARDTTHSNVVNQCVSSTTIVSALQRIDALAAHAVQTVEDGEVLAVVHLEAHGLGQHQRRHV